MKNETITDKLLYREPMNVTEIIVYKNNTAFPVCPRCTTPMERDFQSFCDKCGQMLNWKKFSNAKVTK